MRLSLLAGVALAALISAPLHAQSAGGQNSAAPPFNDGTSSADTAPSAGGGSPLDTAIPNDTATPVAAAPAPTGDPVLDRLNALDAKVSALQAENKALKDQVDADQARLGSVEVRSSKEVAFSWGPTLSDASGSFTFKPRGMLQIDFATYHSRAGGYNFNDGTLIRRGRFGFDGTAKAFNYRIEAEYVGQTVNLLDAFVGYSGIKNWAITVGQQKAPYGLEANSSDAFNEFLERGMANMAFGNVGAERRVGITAAYAHGPLIATVGLFGAGEAVGRNATTPSEVRGLNGRVTFEPVNDTGKLIHLGASGYHVSHFAANGVSIGDRPGSRVDGTNIETIAITGTNPASGVQTGAKSGTLYAFEAAGVEGPFSLQGEYQHLSIDRFGAASTLNFNGWYGFGSVFLTGESRTFKNGTIDRLTPYKQFDPLKGNWGAIELALRYDRLNLTDHSLSPLDHDAQAWTAALNWYLTGNVKILFNYIRFKGENSLSATYAGTAVTTAPLLALGGGYGTTAKGDTFATRLHLDF